MSVPAEEMRRRRVQVAPPAVRQLAAPPAAPQPGVPPTTVIPPSNTVATAGPGQLPSMATGVRPPATPASDLGGQIGRAARAAGGATPLPPGATAAPGSTFYVAPDGSTRAGVQLGAAGQRARAAAGTPMPPQAAAPAAPAAQPAAAPAQQPRSRVGRAAGPLAAGYETLNVVGAGRSGGTEAAVDEGIDAAARLGSMAAGARGGGALPLPGWGRAAAAGVGGILGYLGGDQAIDAVRDRIPTRVEGAMELAGSMDSLTGGQGMSLPGLVNAMSNPRTLQTLGRTLPAMIAGRGPQQPEQAASAALGAEPADFSNVTGGVGRGSGGGGNQIGTFSGPNTGTREIYEDREVPRSPNARGTFNTIPAATPAPAQAGTTTERRQRQEPGFNMPRPNQRRTLEQIDRTIADIGPLDRRGRRSAVVDLLRLRSGIESGTLDRASTEGISAAELAQRTAASELGAEVSREQIEALQQRSPTQTITDAQGNTYSVQGNSLTPLTTPEGEQLQQATRRAPDNNLQQQALEFITAAQQMGTPADEAMAQFMQAVTASQNALGGGQQQAAPTFEQLRESNPASVTDAQIRAYLREQYGN